MATISELYDKKVYDRRYINVDKKGYTEVEAYLKEYNSQYGEGSASITDVRINDNGSYEFTLVGNCISTLDGQDYQVIARRYTPLNGDSVDGVRPQAQYDLYQNVSKEFQSQMQEHMYDATCSCCGVKRNRNDIYIMTPLDKEGEPTGEYKQIGSSCVDKLGGSVPFAKLLTRVNKMVDRSHNRLYRNEASMIEPKQFLACAMTCAELDINFRKQKYGLVECSRRSADDALTVGELSRKAGLLNDRIELMIRNPRTETEQRIVSVYKKQCSLLNELQEQGYFTKANTKKLAEFRATNLDSSFGSKYPEKSSNAFIVALDSVYPVTKASLEHQSPSDAIYLSKAKAHNNHLYSGVHDAMGPKGKTRGKILEDLDNPRLVQVRNNGIPYASAICDYDRFGRQRYFLNVKDLRVGDKTVNGMVSIPFRYDLTGTFTQGKKVMLSEEDFTDNTLPMKYGDKLVNSTKIDKSLLMKASYEYSKEYGDEIDKSLTKHILLPCKKARDMRGYSYYEFNAGGESCRIYGNRLKASNLKEVKANNVYFLAGSPTVKAYVYKDGDTYQMPLLALTQRNIIVDKQRGHEFDIQQNTHDREFDT